VQVNSFRNSIAQKESTWPSVKSANHIFTVVKVKTFFEGHNREFQKTQTYFPTSHFLLVHIYNFLTTYLQSPTLNLLDVTAKFLIRATFIPFLETILHKNNHICILNLPAIFNMPRFQGLLFNVTNRKLKKNSSDRHIVKLRSTRILS
jgi:hypothetical protein